MLSPILMVMMGIDILYHVQYIATTKITTKITTCGIPQGSVLELRTQNSEIYLT